MNKVRYYYGKNFKIANLEVVLGNNNNIIAAGRVTGKIKPIPRVTICGIFNPDDNTISFGVSRCSTKDVFVKSTGKELSYTRAKDTPYKVVKVRRGEKISDRFIENCLEIEEEVLAMIYPISITK